MLCLSELKKVWYKLNWFYYHLKNETLLHRVLRLTRFEDSLMFGSPFFCRVLVSQVLPGTLVVLGGRILAPQNFVLWWQAVVVLMLHDKRGFTDIVKGKTGGLSLITQEAFNLITLQSRELPGRTCWNQRERWQEKKTDKFKAWQGLYCHCWRGLHGKHEKECGQLLGAHLLGL